MKTDKADMVRLLNAVDKKVVGPYCGVLKSEIDSLVAHVQGCFDHEGNVLRESAGFEGPLTTLSWEEFCLLQETQTTLRKLEELSRRWSSAAPEKPRGCHSQKEHGCSGFTMCRLPAGHDGEHDYPEPEGLCGLVADDGSVCLLFAGHRLGHHFEEVELD